MGRRAGQIITRGDRNHLVRVYLGSDENGKRKYLNKTVRGSKKDAQKVLNEFLRDRDMGTLVEPSKQTLNSYLDQWLETAVKPRVRPRTHEIYTEALRWYIRPHLGGQTLDQLSPMTIQAAYHALGQQQLSAKTIRNAHGVLHNALEQACRWKLLAQNPTKYVTLPRVVRKEMRALSPEEVSRFLDEAATDRFYVLFLLAINTGMRPGEYRGLKWQDIDFEASTVRIRRSISRKGEFTPTKTGKDRTVLLSRSILKALRSHKVRQLEERMALATETEYHALDLVFCTPTGKPIDERNLDRRHLKPILDQAGLPPIRLYDLRHTCATLLLAVDENPKKVAERLGHSGIQITLDRYSHMLPGMQQTSADKLEDMMFDKTVRKKQ